MKRTRDLKFRFWDTEENKMILHESQNIILIPCIDSYGPDTHYDSPRRRQNPESLDGFDRWFDHESCFDWSSGDLISGRYIPMQFTGLHDKNEKEIYEGDIIGASNMFDDVVIFKNGGFNLRGGDSGLNIQYQLERYGNYEVLGNIYENPELLK